MNENDPDRIDRARTIEPTERVALGALIAAAILALAFAFWPASQTGTPVTENAPVYRAPATSPTTPPANKPVTPTPAPQQ